MINNVQLIGRLGKDPETRTAQNGTTITKFTVATSEKYKDKQSGEMKEVTEWNNCVTFGKLADISGQYLTKGKLVYVSGKLKTDKYEKDGTTRYFTNIVVNEMKMLGGKSDGAQSNQGYTPPDYGPSPPSAPGPADDIPF